MTKTVLHVGCGWASLENMTAGFQDGSWREIRFDIDPGARPDIVGTITDMTNVESDSVDAVFSSHNIEHVFAHEVASVLAEFRRVLKPDGFIVVTCPDLLSVAEHIVADRLGDPLYQSPAGPITPLDIFYGHSDAIARGQTYMAHKTGFTAKTLTEAAKVHFPSLGVRRRPKAFDLWLIATKQPVERERLEQLMADFAKA
ncbi:MULTISPECIES: class I SAM-dependent methyltransferase [unclassified Sphingomonas]|uniref:class I SAM-dependent methyltransferase n=1 Tax=unclassified Sphingomonas TaxID=196159 RepID=UPI000831C874|nr:MULTISPECIES: methyltransferase domain-containing protein [unclassified Sphingomonas]MCH4891871.1 methyltransferase domain-containing protein [Sphingomonas sp. SFZ2018-12]